MYWENALNSLLDKYFGYKSSSKKLPLHLETQWITVEVKFYDRLSHKELIIENISPC